MASASARREDHFQKNICPKRTFPSDFVKLGSEILYLFLAEKMVVCCLFCFVATLLQLCCNFVATLLQLCCNFVATLLQLCCNFVATLLQLCCNFVATLSDFGLLFKKIEALIELRKILLRKQLFYVRFGNCSTPKVPRFCIFTGFTGFTKMQLT